jgi:hypothetical protein
MGGEVVFATTLDRIDRSVVREWPKSRWFPVVGLEAAIAGEIGVRAEE